MFFDHKTKTYTGELHRLENSKRLVRKGILVSTRHPSQKSLDCMNQIFAGRDVEKEIRRAQLLFECEDGGF